MTHPHGLYTLYYYIGDECRLELGRKSMLGWLDVVVAELLDEVGANEEGGGEEDLDDDEYCDYHCSGFLVVNTGASAIERMAYWVFALQR